MISDFRHTLRQLGKSPGFTVVAVLSLALGIGACTAVFSLCNAILLRSLPVPNPQELRFIQWTGTEPNIPSRNGNRTMVGKRWTADTVHHPEFLNLREQAAPLADLFGFFPVQEVVARATHEPFVASGLMVSDNFFRALGVRAVQGRLLQAGDDDPATGANVVITHRWRENHFAQNPEVIGQLITLNGTAFTIVGVLPPDFPGVAPGDPAEFYVPMQAGSPFLFTDITSTRHWFVRLMARLKPGASEAQLASVLSVAFARDAQAVMKEPAMVIEAGSGGPSFDRKNYQKPLTLMAVVVGLVMLLACANLAGLSLARGVARQHELAVRVALGSSRWRIAVQSLAENLVLAFAGGGLGLAIAFWAKTAISRLLAGSAEGLRYDLSLDLSILGFGLAAALITAVASGLLPAWRASRVDPLDGLKTRGALAAPQLRIGKTLVAAQIALSLLLLTGAALYLQSLVNLRRVDAGFTTQKVLVFQLNPLGVGYKDEQLTPFYARAQEALAAIPGVEGATVVQYPLLSRRYWGIGFSLPGKPARPSDELQAQRLTVGENFFATMNIPILQGRGLAATDVAGAPNALVVNASFARKYFPDEDPLGRAVKIHGITWQIVGVCRDTKYDDLKAGPQPIVYTSFRQYVIRNATSFNVRTALPPATLANAIRRAIAEFDPNVPIAHLTTLDELRDANIGQERLFASLCAAVAGLALLLSCIGLYGLMAYHVTRRRSEIAIRMAIGAQPREVARAILREAFLLGAAGIALGLPAVFAATRLVRSQLYNVQPNDPAILAIVTAALLCVALLAAWIPVRRATRIDPMEALRAE
jgi:predicted permease